MSVLAMNAYFGFRSKMGAKQWKVDWTASMNSVLCASRRIASCTNKLAASRPVLKRMSPWRRKSGLLRQLLETFIVWCTPSSPVTRLLRGPTSKDDDKALAATSTRLGATTSRLRREERLAARIILEAIVVVPGFVLVRQLTVGVRRLGFTNGRERERRGAAGTQSSKCSLLVDFSSF